MPSDYGASIKLNLPSLQSLEKIGSASLIGIKRMGKRLSKKKKEWESLTLIKPLYNAAK